jgi:hypothetical protein
MTHPPETASTVTFIGIPGFCPSGASKNQYNQKNWLRKQILHSRILRERCQF